MGSINGISAAVTSLTKFYHTDETKFFSSAATAGEFPDEIFAVTTHSASTSNQTIVRLIQSADGTWYNKSLIDAASSVIVSLTGVGVGDFERFGNKLYYGNFEHDLMQIRTRHSSGDTDADYVYKAAMPNPNAELVIDRCDETAKWTYSAGATGSGEAGLDRGPSHRLEGRAAISMTQETGDKIAVLWHDFGSAQDYTKFSDYSTSGEIDFIGLEIYRFNKFAIDAITISFGETTADITTNNKYYTIPLVSTPVQTNPDGTTWGLWHHNQNIPVAEWNKNPHDNQLFSFRIRKAWTTKVGSPDWSLIRYCRIQLDSSSKASGTNPAKIIIDNLRVLKTPPVATPYRVQFSGCERQESGSTSGWQKAGGNSTFNTQFAREGIHCLVATACADFVGTPAAAGPGSVHPITGGITATETLTFASSKDFSLFPDGTAATASDVLKINCSWPHPVAFGGGTWDWTDLSTPLIGFQDSTGEVRRVQFGIVENLLGGGTESTISFDPENGGAFGIGWSATQSDGSATERDFDWSSVDKIMIWGPALSTTWTGDATPPYYIDNIRLERPEAMMPVNIFEPVELIALNAISEFSKTILKDWSWVIELAADIGSWIFSVMNYQTYGMGHATYPDYEHSSVGIAGLRLTAYGSKNFGMTLKTPVHSLNNFKIFSFLWPFNFDPANGKWGFVQLTDIPAGPSDKFMIWLATNTPREVQDVTIKFHSANGVEPDKETYWEYKIPGQKIWAKIHEQSKKDKETENLYKKMNDYIDRGSASKEDLTTVFGTLNNPSQYDQVKEIVGDAFNYLGKDRGGWPSAIFEWKKSDMILVRGQDAALQADPDMSSIAGHSIEVNSSGGNATIVVDNLIMVKEGALRGTYYYKVLLEDDEGFLSPSSEPSMRIKVDKKDIVLDDIYVPGEKDLQRVRNKRIYRIGGDSTEWLHTGDMMPEKDQFFDNVKEENQGLAIPEDAYGPPKAKVMKRIGNNMYYGNITDRLDTRLPYRVYQSEPFCPFRVNDFKCIDIPETKGSGITGITEHYNHVWVFTSDGLWTTTRMLTTPVFRSDQGCIAKRSIQVSDFGVIWLSRKGLMIGDVSGIDRKFFTHVNPIFDSYTEPQLANAIGLIDGDYYYLFYDSADSKGIEGGGWAAAVAASKGICVYLPDRSFSELTGPFDVKSISKWDGGSDNDDIYYGRSDGTIFKMFDGDDDNGTAITTTLRLRDFSVPGVQYTKYLKAFYVSMANLTNTDATLAIKPYQDQISAAASMDTITATTTTTKTYVEKAPQGLWGTYQSLQLTGTNRHKITEMMLKVKPEPDAEYLP